MALKLPSLRINRTWVMLLTAIGLALLATMLTTRYLKSREESIGAELKARTQQGGPKVSVTVPTRDMPAGTPLDDNVVAARDVAVDLVYPDAILADDFGKYRGQSLIRPVLKGRPLLKTDLRAMYADFAGSLTEGTRAMTIDVDELNSVAHMVQPGNRIDLMLAMRRDDGGQTVVPFMDRMKVLATGQRLIQDGEDTSGAGKKAFSYANLTLEVSPSQAARLTLAQDLGKLRFVLRNEKDQQSVDFSVNAQNIFDEISARQRNNKMLQRKTAISSDGSVEFIIGGQRAGSGPSTKSVDVPTPGVDSSYGLKVPAIAPAAMSATPAAHASGTSDNSGLTPDMKAELKSLIEK